MKLCERCEGPMQLWPDGMDHCARCEQLARVEAPKAAEAKKGDGREEG